MGMKLPQPRDHLELIGGQDVDSLIRLQFTKGRKYVVPIKSSPG